MPRRSPWYWLAPALLALALYAITVPGTYVYDDLLVARDDPRLGDPHQWVDYLRQGYFQDSVDKLWRPLVSLTYAVQVWAHGSRPKHGFLGSDAWPFHLVNVLLHAAASALVAAFGAKLVNRRVGLLAGLLFAAHPVHVEAVAGIVGRSELMVTIGILAALIMLINKPLTIRRAIGITGWFLFAALSKEQGVLLPALLAAWAMLQRWTDRAPGVSNAGISGPLRDEGVLNYASSLRAVQPMTTERRAALTLTFLLLATLAAYISYRDHVAKWYWERGFLDPTHNPLIASRGADRWLIPIAILGRYTALLFAPWRLSIDYSANVFTPRLDLHDPYFYIGLLAVVLFAILLLLAWRQRWRSVMFCLMALAISYFMASNLVLIGTVFAERLIYLPSVFVCILLAIAVSKLNPKAQTAITTIALLLGSIRTVSYAYQWNDRFRLYEYAHRQQPKAAMIYLLLAGEYSDRGDLASADRVLEEGRRMSPQASRVWLQSAEIKLQRGDLDEAERFALRSLRLRPVGSVEGVLRRIGEMRERKAATKPSGRSPQ